MTDGQLLIDAERRNAMIKFGQKVVKFRIPILIISLLLLIPAAIGYINTGVNYDLLSYLPSDIETMEGQDILVDQFGTGAYSFLIVENMEYKDVSALKTKLQDVEHVEKILWYDSIADIGIPVDMLPDKVVSAFNSEDSTMMMIIFDDTTSSNGTMDAINEIRSICDEHCYLCGMSPIVTDTKALVEQETPIYVGIAVLCAVVVLMITMDSFILPLFFLISIGISIVYNLGTNFFLGEISYVTKALSAVLQLGVTMDYAIFLWHSYKEEKESGLDKLEAMAHAIGKTITSVVGSSVTTVAGFLALMFMSFTLGADLGVVMAKGVVFGVICCITVLPALILMFDKAIEKTSHRALLPKFDRLSNFVTKHYIIFIVVFAVVLLPALWGNNHTPVYYNLDSTLPKDLQSVIANTKLDEEYDMNSTSMILVSADTPATDVIKMCDEIQSQPGIITVLGMDNLIGTALPEDMVPESIKKIVSSDEYKMLIVMSEYKVASDEVNDQCNAISNIIKKYTTDGMLVGEAACTKDLIEITDTDFKVVSAISIIAIFIIIALVFKSVTLPVILVAVIEFAIFINMGIPYYTGTEVPFIASVVIGTIQLGATVDYAILMTTRYKMERRNGSSKKIAITNAHKTSIQSVIVSALSFFAATFGVGLYSNIDMISSLCSLMARGAIISMFVVIFILPSMFMLFDKIIVKTSHGFKLTDNKSDNN